MDKPAPIGVGLQYNPEILDWFPFESQPVDLFEVLLDAIMGPLDSPWIFRPGQERRTRALGDRTPLLAHSNYGCEFGFGPLEDSPAVRRHVALAQAINSPWVADHCFYGDASWLDIWSSPVQFSRPEIIRVADRARRLQDLYGMPLAHENAAYYMPTPGGQMREAEFMARMVERAGTWLHLDLHNVYTNSVNLTGYDARDYLDTIPLDRVLCIHLAGGSWYDGLYHDWHDSTVPEPVWEMLDVVLARTLPSAVILEFQGRAHHPQTRELGGADDEAMIRGDLIRAKTAWDAAAARHGLSVAGRAAARETV
ncbi:hypothetical protein GCM10011505_04290 [Tistrella bauzanensis]|uniref:DUF692 domain-containing protein n=1 Tax=Tistrella bauzanensis TaxID=657419 RepID=A0ABQ1I9A6_9PROT|nr:DUF692 family multinuclear iron-containing protein [Tistrella bauzanensis]GGB26193.1 hypothetical protein GCM10011505_04290 [Tistrella bauzanensis]